MTTATRTSSAEDIIDIRDVIARVEELVSFRNDDLALAVVESDELDTLTALLTDLKGCGGDEQWHGDWYPITLVRDSYFEQHARDLADDIGAVNSDATWPNSFIDWEAATAALQMDYTSVEFDGVTFWYR